MKIIHTIIILGLLALSFGDIRTVPLGGTSMVHTHVYNDNSNFVDSNKVRVFIPELNRVARSKGFALPSNQKSSFVSNVPIRSYGVTPGYYLARVSVSNDEDRRVRAAWIYVG
jgi:hypothetical protein